MKLFKAVTGHSVYWDSIRGLSMITMALIHTALIVGWNPFRVELDEILFPLMEPIFFLSGFLIAKNMSRHLASRPLGQTMWSYAGRRILRTWPLYYVVVVVSFLCPWLVDLPIHKSLLSFLTFTMNINLPRGGLAQMWSLCVEESCYFAFLLVLPFMRSRRASLIFFGLAFAALVGRIVVFVNAGPFDTLNYFVRLWYPTLYHWDSFWYGCILGITWHRLPQFGRPARLALLALSGLILGAYVILAMDPDLKAAGFGQIANPLWGAAISLGIILGIEGLPKGILVWSGLPWVGRMSYSLYLIHRSSLYVAVVLNRRWDLFAAYSWRELVFCYAFLLVTGYVMYRILEVPILNLQQRWFGYDQTNRFSDLEVRFSNFASLLLAGAARAAGQSIMENRRNFANAKFGDHGLD